MARTKPACGCLTEARLLILLSLLKGPLHGYGMMQDVRKLGNSKIRLTNGTLYGALRELTSDGLIEVVASTTPSTSKRRTQPYDVTDVGRTMLAEEFTKLRWLLKLGEARGL